MTIAMSLFDYATSIASILADCACHLSMHALKALFEGFESFNNDAFIVGNAHILLLILSSNEFSFFYFDAEMRQGYYAA